MTAETIFWLIAGLMSLLLVGVLLGVLLRRRLPEEARFEHDVEVYRAQLEEIDREEAEGLITARQAQAARLEVQRRLLAADKQHGAAGSAGPRAVRNTVLAAALAIAVPLGAFALYAWLGNPGLPQIAYSERGAERAAAAQQEADREEAAQIADRLEAQLAENPDNPAAWIALGQARVFAGDHRAAIQAYRRAIAADPQNARAYAALGEAMVLSDGGTVTARAKEQFHTALAQDPRQARALFFLALAKAQDGDEEAAFGDMVSILENGPPDAPWAPTVRATVRELAGRLERPVPEIAREREKAGPSEDDLAGAEDMSPEDRQAMIADMVNRLAERLETETPEDAEGWARLANAYRVMGETEKAARAYGRLAALKPEDVGAQTGYGIALIEAAGTGEPISPEAVAQWQRVLALDPESVDALFFLGEAARQRGASDKARDYWQRLLTVLPEDAEVRPLIAERLEALPEG